jgi:hypothetical protein
MATIKFKGFYAILEEERINHTSHVFANVSFNAFTKQMLKEKRAYTTDVERDLVDGTPVTRRKIIFPLLSVDELEELFRQTNMSYQAETMGSLTAEYGWIPATYYGYIEHPTYGPTHQDTTAYVSVLFEDKDIPSNIDEHEDMVEFFQGWTAEADETIHQFIKDEDWDGMRDAIDEGHLDGYYNTDQQKLFKN